MKINLFLLLLVFLLCLPCTSKIGVSFNLFSHPTAQTYQCFKANDFTQNVIKVIEMEYGVNPFYTQTLKNMKQIINGKTDLLLTPCRSRDPYTLVKEFMQIIGHHKDLYNKIYINSQNLHNFHSKCQWDPAKSYQNCRFIQKIIQAFKKQGINIGMATNQLYYDILFAQFCQQISQKPLFYKKKQNIQDPTKAYKQFKTFAKFSKPVKIQFDDELVCGIRVVKVYSE